MKIQMLTKLILREKGLKKSEMLTHLLQRGKDPTPEPGLGNTKPASSDSMFGRQPSLLQSFHGENQPS